MEEDKPSKTPLKNHPDSVRSFDSSPDKPESPEKEELSEPLPSIEDFPRPADPVAADYHKKPKRRIGPFSVALIILLLATAAIYWFLLRADRATAPAKSTPPPAAQQTEENEQESGLEHHESSNFNLSFDYPKSWTVTDDEKAIKVISPATKMTDVNGEEIDGQIVFHVAPNAANIKELDPKEVATAAIDSEKIEYQKPSPTQRASSYISFLNYYTSDEAGIDGIYVTGDYGYKKDQVIPKSDIEKSEPIFYVVFKECPESDNCKELGDPVTLSVDMWQDDAFADPIKNIFESLTVQ